MQRSLSLGIQIYLLTYFMQINELEPVYLVSTKHKKKKKKINYEEKENEG